MVYAKFGGQTECIMGNWKIENIQGQFQPIAFIHQVLQQGWSWSMITYAGASNIFSS